MNRQIGFDENTEEYLNKFYCILNKMIREMTQAELNDSISHNFIVQMIPHHRAAIEMSENILKYTSNSTLQDIANQIIDEQTQSIENMENIKCECDEFKNSRQRLLFYQQTMDNIMNTMFSRMRCARATNRVNCNFMWEMIPHHRGAVEMARTTLKYSICPQLVPILNAIIKSQLRGIRQMQNLLRTLGC